MSMSRGVFLLVAAAFLLTSPVVLLAQDDGSFSISGGAHLNTYWRDVDATMMSQGPAISPSSAGTTPSPFSDTDLFWNLDTTGSYLNFDFKQATISGRIQLRPSSSGYAYWLGTWDFGAGKLTIGNALSPTSRTQGSLSVWTNGNHWSGAIDPVSRNAGIQLAFPVGGGTLTVAASQPASNAGRINTAAGSGDFDYEIPKLEASYDVRFGGFNLWLGAGYQTYSEVILTTDKEYDINSWLLGVYGSYGFGPVTVNGSVHMIQNAEEYGMKGMPASGVKYIPNTARAVYDSTTDGIINADYIGWCLSAGWKISDILTLQLGYGYQKYKRNANPGTGEVSEVWDDMAQYYVNLPIFAAKGFTITPEIGVQSEEEAKSGAGVTTDQGKTVYYGVKWLIRF